MSSAPALLLDPALGTLWPADTLGSPVHAVRPSGHPALDAQLPGGGWPCGELIELLLAPQPEGTLCGQGEWRLLAPVLRQLAPAPDRSRAAGPVGGEIVFVSPPLHPNAPALASWGLDLARLLVLTPSTLTDAAWATEQALRSRRAAAIVWWVLPEQLRQREDHTRLRLALRRLHLAAQDAAAQDTAAGGSTVRRASVQGPAPEAAPTLLIVVRDRQSAGQASPAPLRLACRPRPDAPLVLEVELLKRRGPPCPQPLWLDTRPAFDPHLVEQLLPPQPGWPALIPPTIPPAALANLATRPVLLSAPLPPSRQSIAQSITHPLTQTTVHPIVLPPPPPYRPPPRSAAPAAPDPPPPPVPPHALALRAPAAAGARRPGLGEG